MLPEQRDCLTLAALPSAVNAVRMFVGHMFQRAPAAIRDYVNRVEKAAVELVRHAVTTTGVTLDAPLYASAFDHLQLIEVCLRVTPARTVIEVCDHTGQPPHASLAAAAPIAEAEDWGCRVLGSQRRVVWCAVAAEPDVSRSIS